MNTWKNKVHQVTQRLRDIGGEPVVLKIKGKGVRVWGIPANFEEDLSVEPKLFSEKEDTPF